jgi:hypothetical protein
MDMDNEQGGRAQSNDPEGSQVRSLGDEPLSERAEPMPAHKPSQAEGDRQTILEDIRQKEERGEL